MADDRIAALRENSELLRSKHRSKRFSRPFYDVMSGGIVWTDEIDSAWPIEVIWALRPLFAYRTSCFAGEERSELRDTWNAAQNLFPEWIGFSKSRLAPPQPVIELYNRRKEKLDGEIDQYFRAEAETGTKLPGKNQESKRGEVDG